MAAIGLAAIGLGLAGCAAPAPSVAMMPACGYDNATPLALRMVNHAPLVMVLIAGKPAVLLLDTGADRTILTRAAADRLGVAQRSEVAIKGLAIGGQADVFETEPVEIQISPRIKLVNRILVTDHAFADGVLGLDFLQRFDLDIHLAEGTVTLYPGGLCPGQSPPWEPKPWEITAERLRVPGAPRSGPPYLMVPVTLDGAQTLAMLDTGALGNPVVSSDVAHRAGVADAALEADPSMRMLGFGTAAIMRLHRFHELRVGNERIEGLVAAVGGDDQRRFPVILGYTYLIHHRVWLHQRGGLVFVAPT